MILMKNPGSQKWSPLMSKTKTIQVPNWFGDRVETIFAVESFETQAAARTWVDQQFPGQDVAFSSAAHPSIDQLLSRLRESIATRAMHQYQQ
ncbi:hypothetical protein [Ralstonia phage phiRSL1]|uniref:Uncharacterized protein n=1 Tax=Ralstonia phage phiRSL1 TaxID=1980924 RepID=C4T8X5_9CAUD|nr:hypothetical protein RSL1_ORF321 [Ralstonia phage phiRSL1]BAH72949.1 hypothetical protein [Ralstonia phage phiRSL1]